MKQTNKKGHKLFKTGFRHWAMNNIRLNSERREKSDVPKTTVKEGEPKHSSVVTLNWGNRVGNSRRQLQLKFVGQHTREERVTQKEHFGSHQSISLECSAECWLVHTYKRTTKGWEKNHWKGKCRSQVREECVP